MQFSDLLDRIGKYLPFVNITLILFCLILIAGVFIAVEIKLGAEVGVGLGSGMKEAVKEIYLDAKQEIKTRIVNHIDKVVLPQNSADILHLSGQDEGQYPTYHLLLDPEDLHKIKLISDRLSEKGVQLKKDKKWFKGSFIDDKGGHKVKVRLRGDLGMHWENPKKSWRIKFKRKSLFNGYRELNFVTPKDKAYEIEPVAYGIARKLGLLVPDHGFARLKINSVDFGLYFWYEQPGKEMLERLGYPEGEILSVDNLWLDNLYTGLIGPLSASWEFYPGGFTNNVRNDATQGRVASRFQELMTLLRTASADELSRKAPTLVDMEKFAKYSAVMWLFGSAHAQESDNLKWYYDTTVGLFEPIPYDVNIYSLAEWDRSMLVRPNTLGAFDRGGGRSVRRLLTVQGVTQRRNEILWELLHDDRFNAVILAKEVFRTIKSSLSQGVGSSPPHEMQKIFDDHLRKLEINRKTLRLALEYGRVFIEPVLRDLGNKTAIDFKVFPDGLSQFKLKSLSLEALQPYEMVAENIQVTLKNPEGETIPVMPLHVSGKDGALVIDFQDISIWADRDATLMPQISEWTLRLIFNDKPFSYFKTSGYPLKTDFTFVHSLTNSPIEDYLVRKFSTAVFDDQKILSGTNMDVSAFIDKSQLAFSVVGKTLSLGPGVVSVDRSLVLPHGYGLKLEAGTTLEMGPGVSLLVTGAAEFIGEDDKPIIIRRKNENAAWGSIGIVNSTEKSIVRHLDISGGNEAWIGGVELTGQLNFYRSDVLISDSMISRAQADDGLNIKKANFEISRTSFIGNSSDGYDGDWTEGIIRQSRFLQNGGDGVDFSGSRILLEDSFFSKMGDKAASIGERSDVTMVNCQVEKSGIGVAVKDLSVFRAYGINLLENGTAIAAYQKKPIFGPGKAEIANSVIWNNTENFVVEPGSSVSLSATARIENLDTPGVTSTDDRIGDIGSAYHRDDLGLLRFSREGASTHPFAKGLETEGIEFLGTIIPNLSKGPVGLFREMEVPK